MRHKATLRDVRMHMLNTGYCELSDRNVSGSNKVAGVDVVRNSDKSVAVWSVFVKNSGAIEEIAFGHF